MTLSYSEDDGLADPFPPREVSDEETESQKG